MYGICPLTSEAITMDTNLEDQASIEDQASFDAAIEIDIKVLEAAIHCKKLEQQRPEIEQQMPMTMNQFDELLNELLSHELVQGGPKENFFYTEQFIEKEGLDRDKTIAWLKSNAGHSDIKITIDVVEFFKNKLGELRYCWCNRHGIDF